MRRAAAIAAFRKELSGFSTVESSVNSPNGRYGYVLSLMFGCWT